MTTSSPDGDRTVTVKGGKLHRNFDAMSFETQGYLDAVNHPNFPSTVVTPQKPMHEVTVFKFGTESYRVLGRPWLPRDRQGYIPL